MLNQDTSIPLAVAVKTRLGEDSNSNVMLVTGIKDIQTPFSTFTKITFFQKATGGMQ